MNMYLPTQLQDMVVERVISVLARYAKSPVDVDYYTRIYDWVIARGRGQWATLVGMDEAAFEDLVIDDWGFFYPKGFDEG